MGKLRVVTLLIAVAFLVGLVGVTAGDSTGSQGGVRGPGVGGS